MELVVAADDRTGALETAAALADRSGGAVVVHVWSPSPSPSPSLVPAPTSVIDLGSRHLQPNEAARRAASMRTTGRVAHKIDSTLRGNWAHELVARSAEMPVLLVPSLPAAGRVCVGGTVVHDGRPVHLGDAASDVRRAITASRPADLLRDAGASRVRELSGVDHVVEWCARPAGIAVADAVDDAAIDAVVAAWSRAATPVLLAGTSAVIGAIAGAGGAIRVRRFEPVTGPVVIACGSLHPAARRQVEVVRRGGALVSSSWAGDRDAVAGCGSDGVLVLTTDIPVGDVDDLLTVAAADSLASRLAALLTTLHPGALVLIGGDTAAAVLGSADVTVHGSVGPGTAWATAGHLSVPIITRSGGFGGDDALVDLVRTTLGP